MSKLKLELPRKVNIKEVKSSIGKGIPGLSTKTLISVKGLGEVGICSMEPRMRTVVFSGEEEDDGKSDHYYGPFHEFRYYIICGEFTLYWGKDESKVRKGTSEKIVLKPGDALHLTPGWKYLVKNTGVESGMFFYQMFSHK
ncbi:MAG: hypothetical protein OEZ21_04180 [Candidatus Bathyarchaeota archaeon]|nr:hypothetical protein [Candidatus Bathyarchaeota archaeon]MDH5746140.1 hypothetical protein [Candidatus Bathyarchaeota archaeon]